MYLEVNTATDQAHLDPADVVELRDDVMAFWRRLRSERADHQVTPSQLQALGHLRRHGQMSAARLAQYEQVAPQSIARTVAILEAAGLVTRSADPNDARAHLLSITDQGVQLLVADGERRAALLTDLLQRRCTPHEREILFLAGRIMRGLAETPVDHTSVEQTAAAADDRRTTRAEQPGGSAKGERQ